MKSINHFRDKLKSLYFDLKDKAQTFKITLKIKEDLFVAILICLVGFISFGLGKLSAIEKGTGKGLATVSESLADNTDSATQSAAVTKENPISEPKAATQAQSGPHFLVASKNGTKYYFPSCSGVSRIKEENKVWFGSFDEAKAAGLTPASNCPGLQ